MRSTWRCSLANTLYFAAAVIAAAAFIICFIRLILGPTSSDRAVALDAMTIISIPIIAYLAFYMKQVFFIDVSLVYALVSFLGIVALARFLERGV